MLSQLYHAEEVCGTATVGSSEAILLGGLAMKRRWQERRKAAGITTPAQPNMVCSSAVHVCWEKLFNYFDIEPRYVNLTEDCFVAPPEKVCGPVLKAACKQTNKMCCRRAPQFSLWRRPCFWQQPTAITACSTSVQLEVCCVLHQFTCMRQLLGRGDEHVAWFPLPLLHAQIAEACDENTIGVVGILGTTYSGHFEDVAGIDAEIGECSVFSLQGSASRSHQAASDIHTYIVRQCWRPSWCAHFSLLLKRTSKVGQMTEPQSLSARIILSPLLQAS